MTKTELHFHCDPSGFGVVGIGKRQVAFVKEMTERHIRDCPYCNFKKDSLTQRDRSVH